MPIRSGNGLLRLDRRRLLEATDGLCERDPALARVVTQYGPPPLWARRPGYATLVRIILEQQVSLDSARAAFARLEAGVGGVTPENVVALPLAELRGLGLTRQKAAYCRNLAVQVVSGNLDLRRINRADNESARDMLLALQGVGPWTADIYLLMALRRPDVWPRGDLALLAAARRLNGVRGTLTDERLSRMALNWRPWRAVAARILWHFYLSERRG